MKSFETGQGLVEYTLVLVLVAIAALMMLISQYFGGLDDQLNEVYCQISEALGIDDEACQKDFENGELNFDSGVRGFAGLARFLTDLSASPVQIFKWMVEGKLPRQSSLLT